MMTAAPTTNLKRIRLAGRSADARLLWLVILVLPWCLWLIYPWTLTPVGAVDAWIYRGLGQNLPNAYRMFPLFYYTSRLFVLLPCHVLNLFLPPGMAHAAYSFGMLYLYLFAISDVTAQHATLRTRFFLVLFSAACPYLLRTEGWGYIDGFVITSATLSLAFLARALRPHYTLPQRSAFNALSGAFFVGMAITHPMAVVLGFTLVWYYLFEQFLVQRRFRMAQMVGDVATFTIGGAAAILGMCVISHFMFGHFRFFDPTIAALRHISANTAVWKLPNYQWLRRADWLLIPALAVAGSCTLLIGGLARMRLTRFEWFAYINAAALLGGMALVDFFAAGFWLQFSYYASYFLPAALLAIAAMLGESSTEKPRVWNIAALAVLLILIAAVLHNVQKPYIAALASSMADLGKPPAHAFSFFDGQLIVASAAVLLILIHRLALRRQINETCWLLPAIAACGIVMLGQISHYPIPTGPNIAASRNIAGVIRLIQQKLGPVRPLFWYDEASPFHLQFASINSAYLLGYSAVSRTFPNLAWPSRPDWRSISDSSSEPWLGGEQLVILTEDAHKLDAARDTFHHLGLDLRMSDQIWNSTSNGGYWIVLARTANVPIARVFWPAELYTTLKHSRLATEKNGARISMGEDGYLAYGPYTRTAPGTYRVEFSLKVDGLQKAEGFLVLDVMAEQPKSMILVSRTIRDNQLVDPTQSRPWTVDFHSDQTLNGVQFRVYTHGAHQVTLDCVTLRPINQGG